MKIKAGSDCSVLYVRMREQKDEGSQTCLSSTTPVFLLFFIPIYFIYRTLEIFSQSPNCLFTKYIYELRVRLI